MSKFIDGEFLIKFVPGFTLTEINSLLLNNGAKFVHQPSPSNNEPILVQANDAAALEKVMNALSELPGVEYVQHNWVVSLQANSNDSYFTNGNLWGMYGDSSTPSNSFGSQAAEAWSNGFLGANKTVIGVIDTGIDYTHPDLYLNIWINQKEISNTLRSSITDVDQDSVISFIDLNHAANVSYVTDLNANGRIDAGDLLSDFRWKGGDDLDHNGYVDDIVGWDFVNNDNNPFDDVNHGTHVAGTIGATGGNGTGVAGVNWNVQMIPLKALGPSGGTSLSTTAAIDYYTNASLASDTGQHFVATNNSWGGGGYSQSNFDAVVRTAQAGNLFVAAAGNSTLNTDSYANYPSNFNTTAAVGFDAVISVAALTSTGGQASFSNYGKTTVDLAAPGQSIYSTVPGGGYVSMQGTSMAAPHVTGALALYASAMPNATAQQLRDALLSTVTPTISLTNTTVTGGRLDIATLMANAPAPPGAVVMGGIYSGTTGNDIMNSGAGNDTLYGLAGTDTLNGLAGNDVLEGGAGTDKIYGGEGSDVYLIKTATDHSAAEFYDYGSSGTDEIRYAATASATLKLYAGDVGIERIVIGTGITANADSSATTALNIDASLMTNALTIEGNAGNNTITGTAYTDQMNGEEGSDAYVINAASHHAAAEIADSGIAGIDEIKFSATATSTLTLFAGDTGVERVTLSGTAALNLDASAIANSLVINGNSAANFLIGTSYADVINGGSGADIYLINSAAEHNQAEITDNGTSGVDEVRFAATTPETLTIFAGDTGIEQVVIGTGSSIQADITGTTASGINASLAPKGLVLIGNAGANSLTGSAYNDLLIGNSGTDALNGGNGSDIYLIENANDHPAAGINDSGLSGNDEIRYTATSAGTFTLFANDSGIEQVVIGTGTATTAVTTGTASLNVNASAYGNALLIIGNAGINTLTATTGNDILDGGAATDFLDGAEGSDIYLISAATHHAAAEISDSGTTGSDEIRFSASAAGTLTLYSGDTGIERVVIGTGSATTAITTATTALNVNAAAVGNALAISGNTGINSLTGTEFGDLIDGKSGTDKLDGRNGSDIYSIAATTEHTAAEITDTGTVGTDEIRFTATASSTLTLYAGDTGIERVVLGTGTGTDADTSATTALNVNANAILNPITIIGNAGINYVTGTSATDQLDGRNGSDVYLINSASHHLAAEITDSGDTGVDEVRFTATSAGTLTLYADDTGIESIVIGTGTTGTAVTSATVALNINATAATNGLLLTGNAGTNTITGTAQSDLIDGKAGTDLLYGGNGSDIYLINATTEHTAAEIIDNGTSGIDELRFTANSASTLILHAGDTGLEKVVIGTGVSEFAVTTGTAAVNINATNIVNGISITGNNGANTLIGTAYNDSFIGNNGNDTLTGGGGTDQFMFSYAPNSSSNRDTITDFQLNTDKLVFSLSIFSGLGSTAGALNSNQFLSAAGAITATDADDRLIYNSTTGILYYDQDGVGGVTAIQVALLGTTTHPALYYSDIHLS